MKIGGEVVAWFFLSLSLVVAASELPASRLIPLDPTLEVSVHEYGDHEAHDVFKMFPRRQVPQVRRIRQPGALLMAVNIRELDLLPGDRLVMRDASNDTVLEVSASNQSIVKRALQRPRLFLWNHPLLMFGDHVTLEYWPSLRTLVLPIDRPQLDNPVVVIDSYSFAFRRRRRPKITRRNDGEGEETNELESTVGATNEMKPAVCLKSSKPEWYNKSRGVARLIIQRSTNSSGSGLLTRFAVQDGAVGSDDARDPKPPTDSSSPSSGLSYTFCTGWLVGRGNHMITNYHCFYELTRRSRSAVSPSPLQSIRLSNTTSPLAKSPSTANGTAGSQQCQRRLVNVNFMAESKTCNATGRLGERVGVIDATSVEILVANQALDYCLLKVLATRNGSAQQDDDLAKKFGYLTMRESGPVDGEAIYIPQHPNGEPKTIAWTKDSKPAVVRVPTLNQTSSRASRATDLLGDTSNISVRYNADTAPGSSGSPVISQRDNTVIALHHAGTGSTRPRSMSTSDGWYSWLVDLLRGGGGTDGRDGSDDGSSGDGSTTTTSQDEWNVGIRIDAIVSDLRKRRLLPPCAVAEKCGDDATKNGTQSQATLKKTKTTKTAPRSACCDATW